MYKTHETRNTLLRVGEMAQSATFWLHKLEDLSLVSGEHHKGGICL